MLTMVALHGLVPWDAGYIYSLLVFIVSLFMVRGHTLARERESPLMGCGHTHPFKSPNFSIPSGLGHARAVPGVCSTLSGLEFSLRGHVGSGLLLTELDCSRDL